MSSAVSAIRSMVGRSSSGTATLGHAQAGDLGDVDREVAHPLEVADHAQRGDDHPQVAGDRLLQGEQGEGRVVDPLAGRVDRLVGADHLLGDLHVAGQQRPVASCTATSTGPQISDEVGEDAVELVMESLTHGPDSKEPKRTAVRLR